MLYYHWNLHILPINWGPTCSILSAQHQLRTTVLHQDYYTIWNPAWLSWSITALFFTFHWDLQGTGNWSFVCLFQGSWLEESFLLLLSSSKSPPQPVWGHQSHSHTVCWCCHHPPIQSVSQGCVVMTSSWLHPMGAGDTLVKEVTEGEGWEVKVKHGRGRFPGMILLIREWETKWEKGFSPYD